MNNLYASGTSDKILNEYPSLNNLTWSREDENIMKELFKCKNKELEDLMYKRHGKFFLECLKSELYNNDYSGCPVPILMRGNISSFLQNKIQNYNKDNNKDSKTSLGFNFLSLFNLVQKVESKKIVFEEKFDICKTKIGDSMLFDFFNSIISDDNNKETTITRIEKVQSHYNSRTTSINNPLMIIIYLPTHTRNGNIDQLMNAIIKYLNEKKLWNKYHIEKSNSKDKNNEEYNDFLEICIKKTKKNNKLGCILFLGERGTTGINYKLCDVIISLDNASNNDNVIQKFERAGTEADGKTIFVIVDYNQNRFYNFLSFLIYKFRKEHFSELSNSEILCYLFEHNIYKFDPDEINYGQFGHQKLLDFCESINKNIINFIDDSFLLNKIKINIDYFKDFGIKYNRGCDSFSTIPVEELYGNPSDETKVSKSKVDSVSQIKEENGKEQENEQEEEEKELYNVTFEICRSFLFPLMALISRIFEIQSFSEMLLHDDTCDLIKNIICIKTNIKDKMYKSLIGPMKKIFKDNDTIINDIREIYKMASSSNLRLLIEKHFIPSNEERNKKAEISTPIWLIDEMLLCIKDDFWNTPKKIIEPCCGKGNFVLGIFEKFYEGLSEILEDPLERCKVIIDNLHFADISPLNVFITTEILRCNIQSKCNILKFDYQFHCYTGDSLEFDFEYFDAVICNPPYNEDPELSADPHKKPLYQLWYYKFSKISDLLLFVTPSKWFTANDKDLSNLRNYIKNLPVEYIKHFPEDNIFKGVKIKGGVSYILIDKKYKESITVFNSSKIDLKKYDIIIDSKFYPLIDSFDFSKNTLSSIYVPQGRYVYNEKLLKENPKEGYLKCFVSRDKGFEKWIDPSLIKNDYKSWKIITTAAAYSQASGFANTFKGNPNDIHSKSYISFNVKSEVEADSLLSYLKCKLPHLLLSLRKITHNITNSSIVSWIPIPPLDRIWDSESLHSYYKLDKNIIQIIESTHIQGSYI